MSNLKFGWGNSTAIVTTDTGRMIPPITLALHISGGHVQTYLTADEAAKLGTKLLEAATSLLEAEVPA